MSEPTTYVHRFYIAGTVVLPFALALVNVSGLFGEPWKFGARVVGGLGLLVSLWLCAVAWRETRTLKSRVELDRCVACGYDLRASPDRCPECGLRPEGVGGIIDDAMTQTLPPPEARHATRRPPDSPVNGDVGPALWPTPADGEPVWPLAEMLYPRQGEWTEERFLALDLMRVELVDGRLEFLPVANRTHQKIVLFLVNLLTGLLRPDDRGEVLFAPFKVRVVGGNFREPDIVVMLAANYGRCTEGHWDGADLAIEVVSPDDPGRDYVVKREAYAAAGVREYWIVDPLSRLLTLLALDGDTYRVVGTYKPGERAASALIEGFDVDVEEVFAVERR